MAGLATALRLQAAGLSTVVLEAHGHAGGCAGYFRHKGFSFDVGATTLVDFEPGGVGGEFLETVGLGALNGERLPGYVAWLPDRKVTLYRDQRRWHEERLRSLGSSPGHVAFWALLDRLAGVFWAASRNGIKLPIRTPQDLWADLRALGAGNLPLARYLTWTLGDALRRFGLRQEDALAGLLGMLVEDTVHSTVDRAPLINSALGVTIRGAGLTRHHGGMHGFWKLLVSRYRELGGVLQAGCRVHRVEPGFIISTNRGEWRARQVVSSLPIASTAQICPMTTDRLRRFIKRDEPELGGAVVAFLGVPQEEVAGQDFTHHQLMQDYRRPLGEGNNMFVSVSAPDDLQSAPARHRAVMISTHTDLEGWDGPDYEQRKKELGEHLVRCAQRVYPHLGERAVVYQVGTPRSYERFTWRPRGAVGGVRQTLRNTNQLAVPHDIGIDGLWLVGDTTWPGLGTVACVLGSRIVAKGILR
ncbi:C-3',4' desaturase CrtD [Rhizocola hellebori]|uniref:C-3',4' desaturase CrtD n=2 Tax=Rhizocola hellebori TaxID=1392758 RepID=A0A8J3QFJ0_9ACTN|nr:C-3',4' desaturase CrtD [Rhizocola hellebori]